MLKYYFFHFKQTRPKNNNKGQGLVEYLLIVALMAIASIGVVRVMNQTITAKFATVTHALQGKKKSIQVEAIETSDYKKKDMKNFFDGVASQK